MIKICGALFVFFACAALSHKKIKKNKATINALNALISALKEMSDSISFLKKPLTEIIASLEKHADDVFFKKVILRLSENEKITVSQAWETALEENLSLPHDAKNALSVLGKSIGKQTPNQETENIAHCLHELEDILKENDEIFKKDTKMLKSFGILSGLMIVILFI